MLGPMLGAGNTKRCRLIPGGDGQLICAITGWGGVWIQSALSTRGPEGLILPRGIRKDFTEERELSYWVLED